MVVGSVKTGKKVAALNKDAVDKKIYRVVV